ncbi:MAG: hypothetical protein UW30_C0001G0028 [Candidatus Giovannonibacteria bacterium GW2011_GWA2_44_13b]|uniref:Uncharacterized protein n=1 Tax=Candidatus Giovannonibacteria bacterium GW2011_GWA2_44_13b TaxID=1618647 RepID=A0A0G1H722_9BACT|nr:MAG: hypothetical protein UW30_C0001G0028 [Candidatus Giovannonibacteria bacterium GW2011_GWA2_44_13b]
MPEQSSTIENAELMEKVELLPYFPTDFERAEAGLKKFNEVFERSEVLKNRW